MLTTALVTWLSLPAGLFPRDVLDRASSAELYFYRLMTKRLPDGTASRLRRQALRARR